MQKKKNNEKSIMKKHIVLKPLPLKLTRTHTNSNKPIQKKNQEKKALIFGSNTSDFLLFNKEKTQEDAKKEKRVFLKKKSAFVNIVKFYQELLKKKLEKPKESRVIKRKRDENLSLDNIQIMRKNNNFNKKFLFDDESETSNKSTETHISMNLQMAFIKEEEKLKKNSPKRAFSEVLDEKLEENLLKNFQNPKFDEILRKMREKVVKKTSIFPSETSEPPQEKTNDEEKTINLLKLIDKISENSSFERIQEILEEFKSKKIGLPYKELQEIIEKRKRENNPVVVRNYSRLFEEKPRNSKEKIQKNPENPENQEKKSSKKKAFSNEKNSIFLEEKNTLFFVKKTQKNEEKTEENTDKPSFIQDQNKQESTENLDKKNEKPIEEILTKHPVSIEEKAQKIPHLLNSSIIINRPLLQNTDSPSNLDELFSDPKLSSNYITDPKLSSNYITDPKISSNFITTDPKISSNIITNDPKISSNLITDHKISSNIITDPKISSNFITDPKISSNYIPDPKISSNYIPDPKIASNFITDPKISSNFITDPKISSNYIPDPKISSNYIANPKNSNNPLDLLLELSSENPFNQQISSLVPNKEAQEISNLFNKTPIINTTATPSFTINKPANFINENPHFSKEENIAIPSYFHSANLQEFFANPQQQNTNFFTNSSNNFNVFHQNTSNNNHQNTSNNYQNISNNHQNFSNNHQNSSDHHNSSIIPQNSSIIPQNSSIIHQNFIESSNIPSNFNYNGQKPINMFQKSSMALENNSSKNYQENPNNISFSNQNMNFLPENPNRLVPNHEYPVENFNIFSRTTANHQENPSILLNNDQNPMNNPTILFQNPLNSTQNPMNSGQNPLNNGQNPMNIYTQNSSNQNPMNIYTQNSGQNPIYTQNSASMAPVSLFQAQKPPSSHGQGPQNTGLTNCFMNPQTNKAMDATEVRVIEKSKQQKKSVLRIN